MSVRVRPPTPASRSRTVIARMLESFKDVRRYGVVVGVGSWRAWCRLPAAEVADRPWPPAPSALHRDGQRLTRCRGDGALAFGGVAVLGGEPHIHVLPGAVAGPVRKIQPDGADRGRLAG